MTAKIIQGLGVIFLLFLMFAEDNAKLLSKSKPASASVGHASVMLQKVQRLLKLIDKEQEQGSVRLSLKDYQELVFDPPRNHTTFVLFYNDNGQCDSCEAVLEAFDRIARSFRRQYTSFDETTSSWDIKMLAFFVKVKMSEGYRNMMVDLNPSEPSLFYFAPSRSLKYNQFEKMAQEMLEYETSGQHVISRMLGFIEYTADMEISLERESPPSTLISTLLTGGLLCLMILFNIYHFGYWNMFVDAIRTGNYAYFITVIVIWLLSGQMFNYIRYTPMFGNYGINVMSVIYPGMRGQYGIESIIIMVLYAVILYSLTCLIETRERQLEERLTIRDVQGSLLGGLSGFYFGFLGLQFISQIKTGR